MTDLSLQSPVGPRVMVAGRERDYFSGTGYLGLHNHPQVSAAAIAAIQRYGMSTATSRGGYGEHPLYERLAGEITAFFGSQASLYYASGYLGGMILTQGLRERYEAIFIDEGSHFSLWDAARASGRPLHSFRHLDSEALGQALRVNLEPGQRPLVMSDGLFPISGELAPLAEYLAAAQAHGGGLAVDDAHGLGVLGANGRGTLEELGVDGEGAWWCGTLSKGLGGFGGIIAANREQAAELERNSRVYVAASPPPLPAAAAAAAALAVARQEPERRQRLWENVALARRGLRALGWDLPDSHAPILCLRARPGVDLARLRAGLFERDVCVAHVTKYSSTPAGGALRIAIFATHSREQIERLAAELGALL